MNNKILSFFAAMLAVACAPAVQLSDSSIEMPESYISGNGSDSLSIADMGWEEFFPDTVLQQHIRAALDSNFSFRNCMDRVLLAANELRSLKMQYYPSVSAGLTAGVQRFGDYTMDGVGNATTNTPDLDPSKHIPSPYPDFGLGASFSWEIDVWGKLTQKKKAAASRWMASQEAVHLAQSVLISDIASTYYELAGLDIKREIISKSIEFISRSCELTEELKDAGEVSQLAADQFNSRYLELKGMLLETENQILAAERAMCILTGRFPEEVSRSGFYELRDMDFVSDNGIPDLLLTRRPDIREAELLLEAADCDIKAARRAFYPGLRIGGSGGFNAFDISKFFLAPASLAYELAAGITAPAFEAGKIRTEYNNSIIRRNIAVNTYKETVVKAYTEVTGLICDSESISERISVKKQEMRSGKRATESANELFRMQFIGYLEVLSADRDYFECCRSYIDLEVERMKIQARLFRALGGGGQAGTTSL